jgi:hypothetical protein
VSSFTKTIETWNRKFHFYLGLYFLFFLWLFALTGLMLNHGQWLVSLAANRRQDTHYERVIEVAAAATDLDRARDVMQQLGLMGEIEFPAPRPGSFAFNTSRPSDSNQVRVDLAQHRASVQHFENGYLGRFRILHTFSGSRFNQAATRRDWVMTSVWVLAMDALAAGLVVMVLGSYLRWWRLKPKRRPGLIAIGLGTALCLWFVSGIQFPFR